MNELIEDIPAVIEYPPTKRCWMFDAVGFLVGEAVAYLVPGSEGEYYANPMTTYTQPTARLKVGQGLKVNANRDGWLVAPYWSDVPLFSTETSLTVVNTVPPGENYPEGRTHLVPPAPMSGQWPHWDTDRWVMGDDLTGTRWHTADGRTGQIMDPWQQLPPGAILGESQASMRARMQAIKRVLLRDANDMMDLATDYLNGPNPTTGDQESLVQAKAFKTVVLSIRDDQDPDAFVYPDYPTMTLGQGEPLSTGGVE